MCDCTWILFFLTAVIVTPRRFKVVRGLCLTHSVPRTRLMISQQLALQVPALNVLIESCILDVYDFLLSLPKTNNRSRTRENLLAVSLISN